MKRIIYWVILLLLTINLQSQVMLTFIGNEGIPLDSVRIVNLDQDCDTTLYGIAVSLYLQDATISSINEYAQKNQPTVITAYDLQGRLIDKGTDVTKMKLSKRINILHFQNENGSKVMKIYGRPNEDIRPAFKSVTANPWIWYFGDLLEITGYATGYYPITITDNPTESKLYVFDFQPSIVGVVQGHVFYEDTEVPIYNANVSVAGVWDYTDSTGFYQIAVAPGYHPIYASKPGFDDFGSAVQVNANDTINLNIELASELYTHDVDGVVFFAGEPCNDYGITYEGNLEPDETNVDGEFAFNSVPEGERRWLVTNYFDMVVLDTVIPIYSDTTLSLEITFGDGCEGITEVEYGGQIYNTVEIYGQCWFKENLNVGTFITADSGAATDNGIIEKFCYMNDITYCDTLGALYAWDEMMQYNPSAPQGICPDGWHVPSDVEVALMESLVEQEWEGDWLTFGWRGEDVGTRLKEAPYGSNDFDMSVKICGGYLYGNQWYSIEDWGDYWTSTESEIPYQAILRYFAPEAEQVNRANGNKWGGKAVRCLKD